jgi:hypothetical protein
MNRREVLSAVSMSVGSAALLVAQSARGQEPHHHHDKLHGECLKACSECANICNETFHHCFEKVKDGHGDHHVVTILTIDCQEFCGLASELLARESPTIPVVCVACADACMMCAAECSKHGDPQMKECTAACKACETACRAMAKAAGEAKPEVLGR